MKKQGQIIQHNDKRSVFCGNSFSIKMDLTCDDLKLILDVTPVFVTFAAIV